jgi:hypothetical protein
MVSLVRPLPPLPWRHKASRPYSALGGLRFRFLGRVDLCKAIRQGPALPHHPCVDIGAIRQRAYRKDSPVSIEGSAIACQLPPSNVRPELTRGRSSAGPRRSFGIGACLIRLGRVDALQANAGAGYLDRVAVDNPRIADDGWLRLGIAVVVGVESDEARCHNDTDDRWNIDTRGCVPCGVSSGGPSSHGGRSPF